MLGIGEAESEVVYVPPDPASPSVNKYLNLTGEVLLDD